MNTLPRYWHAALAFALALTAPAALANGFPKQHESRPIALTPNARLLVNVNPEANSVTIFNVAGMTVQKVREINTGIEPVNVAVHPDGTRAFVAHAGESSIGIIDLRRLRLVQKVRTELPICWIAFSPLGRRLYGSDASGNKLHVFAVSSTSVRPVTAIDLSAYGTSPGAITVTNDGDRDESDETIFVAMFFAQLRPGKGSVDEGQDDQRQGNVVAISAANNMPLGSPNPIVLGPIANAGFNSNGKLAPAVGLVPAVAPTNPQTFTTPTGAYPNQLAQIAVDPSNPNVVYVVSTGASPNGPVRFNSNTQGLVSVFNSATRMEITSSQTGAAVRQTAPLNLNQGVNFDTANMPRLFMSNPVAMAWRPDGSDAWVVIQNSDLVVRLTADGNGIPTVGNPTSAGGTNQVVRVDLQDVGTGAIPGKAPRGIVINPTGTRAFVSNFVSRSVTVIDISNGMSPTIVDTALSTRLPTPGTPAAKQLLGAELFFTGRGPQERMSSESWGGCIVCHPNGRSDNVTWMFAAGPRQTVPLDASFGKRFGANPHQRVFNWSGIFDEPQDFELNTRGVFGGRGLIDDDRLVLAIGGASGATPTDSALVEQFQNFTGVVGTTNDLAGGAPLPTLIGARRDFGVATLSDDRIFIIGGRSGSGQGTLVSGTSAVLEYNPRTNTLTPRSSTGFTPRHSLGAASVNTPLGQRIYAIGGYASTTATVSPVTTVEEYDPATNSWTTNASLPTAVAQFGIVTTPGINTAQPRDLVHVVGGNAGPEATPTLNAGTNKIQRLLPNPTGSGVWSTFGATGITARRNHGVATAIRGAAVRVFVIGGQDAAGTVLDTVEEYESQTVNAVLTTHTSLPAPRARFGIGSTLTTNQIYVIGGVDGTGAEQTSVLEYSIGNNGTAPGPLGTPSGTWVVRGNLSAARQGLGLSMPPGVTSFLPAGNTFRDEGQDAIALWMRRNVRASRAPVSKFDSLARHGRSVFAQEGCVTCHGGPTWTRSVVDYFPPPTPEVLIGVGEQRVIGVELRSTASQPLDLANSMEGVLKNVGTFLANAPGGRVNEIRTNPADISHAVAPLGANGFNIPSLLSVHETAPYFYSGLAQTLEEVLDGSQDGNSGFSRPHFISNPSDRAALIQFLRSIDNTTPIFP